MREYQEGLLEIVADTFIVMAVDCDGWQGHERCCAEGVFGGDGATKAECEAWITEGDGRIYDDVLTIERIGGEQWSMTGYSPMLGRTSRYTKDGIGCVGAQDDRLGGLNPDGRLEHAPGAYGRWPV